MRALRRLIDDPDLLRRVTYAAGGAAAVVSMVATLALTPEGYSGWAAYVIPVAVLASLPSRPWRSLVLAVGAGVVAAATGGDPVPLWLGVAALVFGSLVEDLRPAPWVGWAGGLVGSLLALVVAPEPAVAPFVGVVLGGTLGMLLRTRLHSLDLAQQAEGLRDRTTWLEQRTNLARELHDVLGHHVTAMVVQAEAGQLDEPQAALRNISELGRAALGELDGLVVHLRDPDAMVAVTAPPRVQDIDELLAAPLRQVGVEVDVRADADLGLDEAEVLTVYRIAQEALTNVVRHAHATHAWVDLRRTGKTVSLRVSDDGVGTQRRSVRGSGLIGIGERVSARGGAWQLAERPGGGSVLEVSFPVARQ